ncbi:MAG TPA: hypothetical protein VK158_00340 [Acidobacteriota bacterium]|nr:hypothetical protein [Acidobacteriota bacterium]
MNVKRGQSALEFLFTYAWAFLIILIMIAALAFFGVLDPAKFVPDKCLATTGFTCMETRVQRNADVGEGHIQIRVANSGGKVAVFDANPYIILSGSSECNSVSGEQILANDIDWVTENITLGSGQEMLLQINCSSPTTPATNERVQVQISGNYTDGGTLGTKPFDLLMNARVN